MKVCISIFLVFVLLAKSQAKSLRQEGQRGETSGHAAGQGQGTTTGAAGTAAAATGTTAAGTQGSAHISSCSGGTGSALVVIGGSTGNVANGGGNGTICGSGNTGNTAVGVGPGSSANTIGVVDLNGTASGFGEGLIVNGKVFDEDVGGDAVLSD